MTSTKAEQSNNSLVVLVILGYYLANVQDSSSRVASTT